MLKIDKETYTEYDLRDEPCGCGKKTEPCFGIVRLYRDHWVKVNGVYWHQTCLIEHLVKIINKNVKSRKCKYCGDTFLVEPSSVIICDKCVKVEHEAMTEATKIQMKAAKEITKMAKKKIINPSVLKHGCMVAETNCESIEEMEFLIHHYGNGDITKMTIDAIAFKHAIIKALNKLGWYRRGVIW